MLSCFRINSMNPYYFFILISLPKNLFSCFVFVFLYCFSTFISFYFHCYNFFSFWWPGISVLLFAITFINLGFLNCLFVWRSSSCWPQIQYIVKPWTPNPPASTAKHWDYRPAYHTWFVRCWGLKSEPLACWASILPTDFLHSLW